METRFAQTNLELYQQLINTGYSREELLETANCYWLTAELLGSAYRRSGKHFVHHMVGTASVLAWAGHGTRIVNAGLLHSVYERGDFGVGSDPRKIVRDKVGPKIESLVWSYHNLQWSPQVVKELARAARPMNSVPRPLLVMRLANHVEDHVDNGMLFYPGGRAREGRPPGLGADLIHIAKSFGETDIAAALESLFGDYVQTKLPDAVRPAATFSEHQAPLDTLLRPRAAVRMFGKNVISRSRAGAKKALRKSRSAKP